MKLMDYVTLNFNNNMSTAAVFLDMEKASDTAWHLGFLYKLDKLKFSISLVKLISSFLSQRKFRISVEGEMTTPRDIQVGVPQGSFLSPTLYSTYIYIYDTPKPLVSNQVSMLITPVYMRQTAKKVMLSESCSEVSVLLRLGANAGT
jgi:hypothetical protein